MCKLFINVDLDFWVSRIYFLCIDGMVISICMENIFWQVFGEFVECDGMNLFQMIICFYYEFIDVGYDLGNFILFFRVCVMCYLVL